MGKFSWIRFVLLAGLMLSLPLSNASAVTISLRPDRSTTIMPGETVNVNVFMVLDGADQGSGIGAATLHLELGSAFVSVVASAAGSPFPSANATVVPPPNDFIAFSQFGTTVNAAEAQLGTLAITGVTVGSYDLVARRFGSFPLFTAPGDITNRYDFTSDETVTITIVPEPSSWFLLSLGIGGMVMIRRKLASRA